MTRRTATALAALFLLLAACDLAGPIGEPEIAGSWRLTGGTHDGAPVPMVAAAPITMTVDGSEIGGTAACNHYGGEVEIGNGTIRIGSMAVTEMGCDPAIAESESAYLAALGDVEAYERNGTTLTFSGEGVELIYEFVPPTPDADLFGPTWILDSLIEGETASSVMGEPATLELRDDGTLSGTTGCRSFDAGYTVSDQGISVAELVTTDQACPGLERQDEHVLGVIADGFAYEIEGDRLTLTHGDRGLIYRLAGE